MDYLHRCSFLLFRSGLLDFEVDIRVSRNLLSLTNFRIVVVRCICRYQKYQKIDQNLPKSNNPNHLLYLQKNKSLLATMKRNFVNHLKMQE